MEEMVCSKDILLHTVSLASQLMLALNGSSSSTLLLLMSTDFLVLQHFQDHSSYAYHGDLTQDSRIYILPDDSLSSEEDNWCSFACLDRLQSLADDIVTTAKSRGFFSLLPLISLATESSSSVLLLSLLEAHCESNGLLLNPPLLTEAPFRYD